MFARHLSTNSLEIRVRDFLKVFPTVAPAVAAVSYLEILDEVLEARDNGLLDAGQFQCVRELLAFAKDARNLFQRAA